MKVVKKFLHLFRRRQLDVEMTEEMQAHVDLQTERNLRAGMSPEDARYAALRQFGNVTSVQQQARTGRGWVWLEQFGQDLRYAVRQVARTPGVTTTAVLTLALGIGVNAAVFAVYDILVLRPLPSRDPDQLVDIRGRHDRSGAGPNPRFSYPDYLDYCEGTQAFSDLVAVTEIAVLLPEGTGTDVDATEESRREVFSLQVVSGNYFSTLGAAFSLGRDFRPEEAGLQAGRPVIVLSHQFWQKHFRGDPKVLGQVLMTQDKGGAGRTAYTIIGVAASDFVGQSPFSPAGWVPLTGTAYPRGDRENHFLSLTGRMRAGFSLEQAKADLDLIARRLAAPYPDGKKANAVQLLPGMRIVNLGLDRNFAIAMSPVLLGFALVLVISCLNVANLLLARGVTRQHEIGVRLVLGASRGRLVRQLFAENFLLCLLGAGAALLMAIWSLEAMRPALVSALAGEPKAQAFINSIDIGLDRRIVGFGALLAAVAGLTAGLAPALHSVRRDGMFALKGDGTAFGRKLTVSRLRSLLLIGQVAVCLTLLATSGLMTGKLLRIRAAGTGFVTEGVYVASPAAGAGVASALSSDPLGSVENLRTLPGVASACMVSEIPLRKPGGNVRSVLVAAEDGKTKRIAYNRVSAGFFEAFGVPVVRGRAFTLNETSSGAAVVIVDEAAARRLWPGQEALGKVLPVDDTLFVQRTYAEGVIPKPVFRECLVIGVSRHFRSNWGGDAAEQLLLFPLPAKSAGQILVRLQTDSAAVMRGVERSAAAAGLPVKFQESLEAIVDRGLWPYRAFARISGTLTALSLVLATVGLYGVVSFGVNQRTKEIGVRMALGATAERVTGLFVRQGMKLVAWGIAIGLAGGTGFAVLLGKVMPGADFVGSPLSRCVVFAVVTVLLVVVALIACWLPARRAAKVDPVVALRAE